MKEEKKKRRKKERGRGKERHDKGILRFNKLKEKGNR
jgi:hypothetical protein